MKQEEEIIKDGQAQETNRPEAVEETASCHSEECSTSCHSEEHNASCHSEEHSDEESGTTSLHNDTEENAEEPIAEVDELQALKDELEQQQDKFLRLSAEFDNYRKRTLKEKAELILNGGEKSITAILPVIDDLERALTTMQSATDVDAVRQGVELIYNKFITILSVQGVKIIDTKELPLDTDFHEAIAVLPAPAEELKGKILDCVQTGYMLNDKVIRHSKVVVGE